MIREILNKYLIKGRVSFYYSWDTLADVYSFAVQDSHSEVTTLTVREFVSLAIQEIEKSFMVFEYKTNKGYKAYTLISIEIESECLGVFIRNSKMRRLNNVNIDGGYDDSGNHFTKIEFAIYKKDDALGVEDSIAIFRNRIKNVAFPTTVHRQSDSEVGNAYYEVRDNLLEMGYKEESINYQTNQAVFIHTANDDKILINTITGQTKML